MAIWDGPEQAQFPALGVREMTMPKHFHYIWNHSPLPEVYRQHGAKLVDLHRNWTYTFWDDDKIHAWMAEQKRLGKYTDLVSMLEDAYANVKDKRQVSDLFRLAVLHEQGGVYLDFDYTPIKNFEPLLGGAPVVLTCPSPRNIANGFIAAEKGDSFIAQCLDNLLEAYYSSRAGATHKTGPRFITQMYRDFLERTEMAAARLLPQKYFYPYTYNRLDLENEDFPDAYAVHRWASKKGDVWIPEERA